MLVANGYTMVKTESLQFCFDEFQSKNSNGHIQILWNLSHRHDAANSWLNGF